MSTGRSHVSVLNAALAQENIKGKLQLIRSCIRTGTDGLDALPATLRQFNLWAVRANQLGPGLPATALRANSNESVRRVPELRASVTSVIQDVIDARKRLTQSSRENRLARVKRRLEHSELLRSIAERELGEALIKLEEASAEIRKLRASVESQGKVAREEIDRLEQEVSTERRRNAELTASLKKVARMDRIA